MKQEIKTAIEELSNSEISKLNRYAIVVTEKGAEFLVVILMLTDIHGKPTSSHTYFVGVFEDGEWIVKNYYDKLGEAVEEYQQQIISLL